MSASNFVEDDNDKNGDLEDEILCTHLFAIQLIENEKSPPASSSKEKSSSSQENKSLNAKDAAIAVGVAGTAGVAVPLAGTACLTGIGFTSSGVAAGSLAAGFQAGVGNIAAGSLFAAGQSIGATGGFAIWPVGVVAAAVGGLGYLCIKALRNWRSSGNQEKYTENTGSTDSGYEGAVNKRPMCSECRKKLLLRITRNFFVNNMAHI